MKRLLASLLLLLVPVSAPAAEFKLIVNNAVPVDSLTKKEISDLFMKRKVRWGNGAPVVPIDQSDHSPAREEFSKIIFGKPVAAIRSYWQQQIFTGRDVPPVEQASDKDVVNAVRANGGAIGYVDSTAETPGVKVIRVQ